jgi:hypothetical protein
MNISPRYYLVECALIVAIFVPIVLMFCAVAIACEVSSGARRVCICERGVAPGKFSPSGPTPVEGRHRFRDCRRNAPRPGKPDHQARAQVKTSSEASTAAANTQAKATTAAVTNAIEHTSEAIQAASGEVLPLKVEPLKSPITVNVPAPVVVHAPEAEVPTKVDSIPAQPKRRRWYRYIWPWRGR